MISIIVPIYNVEAYLPQCLDSLIHQTYQDLEIICVNDGSIDHSLEILQGYSDRDKRIKIISRENRGISASRNEALDAAKGEYVIFVDSDDWIDLQTCERAIDVIQRNNYDLIMWSYVREFSGESLPNHLYNQVVSWDNGKQLCRRIVGPEDEELRTPQKLDSYGTVWGKLFKRELIEKGSPIRFVDTSRIGTCEDVLFNIEYSLRTEKSICIPETLYHYRKLKSSFTSKYRAALPGQWQHLYELIKDILKRKEAFVECKQAYLNRISLGLVGLGLNITFSDYSFTKQRKMLSLVLSSPQYIAAIQTLSVKYMPIHWRFFYNFAKQKRVAFVLLMLRLINRIIR